MADKNPKPDTQPKPVPPTSTPNPTNWEKRSEDPPSERKDR